MPSPLEALVDAYLAEAGIANDKESPLFPSVQCVGEKQSLTVRPLLRTDAYAMVKRRLIAAGISGDFCCHSFRATGITNYLENGTNLEMAQYIAVMPTVARRSYMTIEDKRRHSKILSASVTKHQLSRLSEKEETVGVLTNKQ